MWHTNGVPKLQVHYNNGKIDGTLTTFWKNGKIRREDIYKNGDIQKGRCLNPLGEPTAYYPYVVYPEFPGGEYRLSRYMLRLTTARYYTPTGRCIQKPYKNGIDQYERDLLERDKHGEFFHEQQPYRLDKNVCYQPLSHQARELSKELP